MRCVPAFAAEITCIAIDAAATSAAGATEHSCGAAGTVFQAARGVSCTAARRLACRHSVMNGRCHVCALAKPSCRLDGCTCRRTLLAGGDTRVRCTTGAKRVRFF